MLSSSLFGDIFYFFFLGTKIVLFFCRPFYDRRSPLLIRSSGFPDTINLLIFSIAVRKIELTCRERGSNTRPSDLQSDALPTELSRRVTRPGIEPGLPRPQRGVLTTILTGQYYCVSVVRQSLLGVEPRTS